MIRFDTDGKVDRSEWPEYLYTQAPSSFYHREVKRWAHANNLAHAMADALDAANAHVRILQAHVDDRERLRDEVAELRSTIAAKDAEIARLRTVLQALYDGPQAGDAEYEMAKFDAGRYLRDGILPPTDYRRAALDQREQT
jgi:hypothetical protein